MKKIEDLMSISQYARKHDITVQYVYYLINSRKIKQVVIGGKKFVDSSQTFR